MAELRYVIGDATEPIGDGPKVIPHITNNIGAWGAGFVLALSKKWPRVRQAYLDAHKNGLSVVDLGRVQWVVAGSDDLLVANMCAQEGIHHNTKIDRPPIRYAALARCMDEVCDFASPLGGRKAYSVHAPRFGAGLAGGDWATIEGLILELWVDRGLDVTIYDLA